MLHKMRVLIIAFIAIIFSSIPIIHASAAAQLEVKATSGFQSKAKYGQGLPLIITVTNNGDTFSGDLVIDYTETYAVGSAKAIPFEIGAGETKTLQLALPGLSDQYMYSGSTFQMFHFYEGGWEKGKSIDYKGTKSVRPSMYDQMSPFILTLTDSADRLRFLSNVNFQSMNNRSELVHVAQIKDFILPSDAVAWSAANYLIIDEYVLSDLSEAQQQAILGWIQNGGVAVVGASENTVAEMGMLGEHLPLVLSTNRTTIPATVFANSSNGAEFTEDIPSFEATIAEGARQLLSVGDSTLVGVKSFGQGSIVQTAFSLGDEPLTKQPGYSAFITEVFKKVSKPNFNSGFNYGQSIKERLVYEVGYTNELFPSFKVSTPLMLGIIGIYILLIGPLMYFILKRRDKRESAWWIIPIVAVVTSVGLFAYGAKDRLVKPQIQQSSILQVNEDGSLSGYYVQSLLSNRGGNFSFEAPNDTTMTASLNNQFSGSDGSAFQKSVVEQSASSSDLTLRNVGYWSVNSILGQTFIKDAGKLDIQLKVENGDVTGTIKNDFPFVLKEVSIWSGSKQIELGELNPGETIDVRKTIGTAMLVPVTTSYNYNYGYNAVKASELTKARKDNLVRMSNAVTGTISQPAIVAYTEDAIVPIELKDSKAEMSNVNVILQTFTPETKLSGEFSLPSNSLTYSLTAVNPTYYDRMGGDNLYEWYMEDGDYEYIWSVPPNMPLDNVTWSELQLTSTNNVGLTSEILNVKTNEYEEIPSGRFKLEEDVQNYISSDGKIQFLLHKKMQNHDSYTKLPELRLKGVVQ